MENFIMTAPEQASSHIRIKTDKVCLVDADFLKYYVCGDISGYIKREGHHPSEKMGEAYMDVFVDKQLERHFWSRFDCPGFLFVFGGDNKNTFRYALASTKEYKGNRWFTKEAYDGFYLDLAKVIGSVSRKCNVYINAAYEADDVVCYLQNERTFIYSHDKDLKQVPGLHFDFDTFSIVTIDEDKAFYALAVQLLTGDSTDNIAGVEGIGKKTAEKELNGLLRQELISKVIDIYLKKYGSMDGYDRFCESWMLIKMRFNRGGYEELKLGKAISMRDQLINR